MLLFKAAIYGIVRRNGLKIYFVISCNFGAIPWNTRTFDNSICNLCSMSLHNVPPISRTRFLAWDWKCKCRCVGIGRRGGLKIHCQRWCAGSSPATGTMPAISLFSRNCGFFFVPPLSLHRSILRVIFSCFVEILGGTLEGHFLDRSGIDTQNRICRRNFRIEIQMRVNV